MKQQTETQGNPVKKATLGLVLAMLAVLPLFVGTRQSPLTPELTRHQRWATHTARTRPPRSRRPRDVNCATKPPNSGVGPNRTAAGVPHVHAGRALECDIRSSRLSRAVQ